MPFETRYLERLQFFDGQRLFASDLQGIEAFNREMRWLHNNSLHQPGIGSGFAVNGKAGDRQVIIGPGYAIDALGREIVLTQTHEEPIPPVSSEEDGESVFYELTVSYPDDSALKEAETRAGICQPRGTVRLQEAPVFCWVRLQRDAQGNLRIKDDTLRKEVKDGLKIILAQIEVFNCQLKQAASIAQRRNARPPEQPYIACGQILPDWSFQWSFSDTSHAEASQGRFPLMIKATIDTSEAGFLTPPCYLARVEGSRAFEIPSNTSEGHFFLMAASISVENAQTENFEVHVLVYGEHISISSFIRFSGEDIHGDIQNHIQKNWKIVWMGIEG